MPEPDEQPAPGMEELVAKAIRPSRMLSVEDLLANELATAVLSEPLPKIRHVCEGLMLLEPNELEKVGISEAEAKEARMLYAICQALLETHVHKRVDRWGHTEDLYAAIAWTFPRKNAGKMLKWAEDLDARAWGAEGSDKTWPEWVKEAEKLEGAERTYEITRNQTTMNTYRPFVARFIEYAMPKITPLMRKVISRVSLDTYLTALKTMRGKGRVRI